MRKNMYVFRYIYLKHFAIYLKLTYHYKSTIPVCLASPPSLSAVCQPLIWPVKEGRSTGTSSCGSVCAEVELTAANLHFT